ncbi:MAG: class I SAM-dependent methyltransferase [Nitrospirota bacterium]|jgi:predicted O-methyltransferase YrrM
MDPSQIFQLATGYWASQTFLTANRMGLFATLATGPMTVEGTAERLATAPRATRLLMNACVALGLLHRDGDQYSNTPPAAAFLVPGSPGYLGDSLLYADDLYLTWADLETAVRHAAPLAPPETILGDDPTKTRHFVRGMHHRAIGVGRALVEMLDLTGRRRLLDVGGGPGTYSCLLANRYPELHCTVLDLPPVVAIAREIIGEMGAADRVETLGGDFHQTDFPADNDVVLISGLLHRESEEGCREAFGRARAALRPGGLLVVSDVMTEEGGDAPPFATLFGLNMLLTSAEGGVHSHTGCQRWMAEAGFQEVAARSFPPPMPHWVVTGTRP